MSDELEEFVDNIREPSFWTRILLMIAFALVFYIIILPLILVLTIAQALFTLITGEGNANLRYFSRVLALYVPQLIEFLTYLSERRPYPFSDLPEVEDDSLQEESNVKSAKKQEGKEDGVKTSTASTADKKAVDKAKVVKKKTAKKKAVKKKAAKKAAKTTEPPEADAGGESAIDS